MGSLGIEEKKEMTKINDVSMEEEGNYKSLTGNRDMTEEEQKFYNQLFPITQRQKNEQAYAKINSACKKILSDDEKLQVKKEKHKNYMRTYMKDYMKRPENAVKKRLWAKRYRDSHKDKVNAYNRAYKKKWLLIPGNKEKQREWNKMASRKYNERQKENL